ncbi:hypothetical protein QBC35DRAFT_543807 [Podospora australis]|uniref:RRM domain-containing protein n=1 Tax=Podospora australis TaxID=1536484 RepID=A0AAN6WLD5_9PEZI|nr:hypothetical protein QBC35DRAFT_543807 [Podospora australis]
MESRAHRRITQQEAQELMIKGFSPNYRGNPDLDRNRSAMIPEGENCSLFLVGLPPNISTHDLLAGVRGIGRVYATHINPPEPNRGHEMSAAKLVFFDRDAAERFYAFAQGEGFRVPANPTFRARVTWNRIRSAQVDPAGVKSRVLLISGPPEVVNEGYLRAYFDQKLIYQIDEILSHGTSPDGSRALVEFRFGSYRCQAEAARMALSREFREWGVLCEFGTYSYLLLIPLTSLSRLSFFTRNESMNMIRMANDRITFYKQQAETPAILRGRWPPGCRAHTRWDSSSEPEDTTGGMSWRLVGICSMLLGVFGRTMGSILMSMWFLQLVFRFSSRDGRGSGHV